MVFRAATFHLLASFVGGRESRRIRTAGDHRGWRAVRLADGVPRRSFHLLCVLRAGIANRAADTIRSVANALDDSHAWYTSGNAISVAGSWQS